MLASACGSLPIVKLLCETKELDIEATDNEGFSALSLAAQRNLGNIVRLLLEKKANPNSRSRRSKRTPWMEAAISGSAAAVRELMLSPKIDSTCCNDANRSGTWFLMCGSNEDQAEASKHQHLSITQMVLEFHQENLSINEADILGITPLHLLASRGDGRRFELRRLLELKADLRYRSWTTGLSAFHIAALYSAPLILNELLEASRSDDTFDCKDLDHATPLSYAAGNSIKDHPVLRNLKNSSQAVHCQMVRMLINRGADVNSVTLGEGRTPLMFAACLGWNEVVALLLENGAGGTVIDTRDKNYATALSLAVISGHFATVQRLLEANASCNIKDKTGATTVIIAAGNGHLPLLRLFLNSHKLSINDRDRDGRTALSYAAEFGHKDVVHYLLEQLNLAEVDTLDRQDQTALVWACKKGHCVIIGLLKDHGADHKHKDRNGRTPFSHAAENGQTAVLRHLLLLEEENNENSLKMLEWKDAGRTALSWAAEEGRLETVRLLLRWGADPLSSNKRKMTPRMFALDRGHTKVAKLLASDHTSSGLIPGNTNPITRQPSLPTNLSPVENFAIESENDSPASNSALNLSGQATGASGGPDFYLIPAYLLG
jgi:serine/threonine-protein phosphatase 6 regulatory ankyrin repeat subunit A